MIRGNFIYFVLPSLLNAICSFLFIVPLTTYYLDPKDFGIFAILSAFVIPIGPIASVGVSWVLGGNYYKLNTTDRKCLLFNVIITEIALKSICILIFYFMSDWALPKLISHYKPIYLYYFKIILFATWLSSAWPSVSYFIVLSKKSKVHAFIEILQLIVRVFVLIICLYFLKLGLVSLFLAPFISNAASCLFQILFIRKYIILRFDKKWFKEIIKTGSPAIPANIAESIGNVADRFFIQKFSSLIELGIYSHSLSYNNLFKMMNKAFSRTFSPIALEVYLKNKNTDRLKKITNGWYFLLTYFGILTSLFAKNIIDILTHGKFVTAFPLVTIWYITLLLFAYGMPYTQFLMTNKKVGILTRSQLASSIFLVFLSGLFIYLFGIVGASVSVVLSNLTTQLWRMFQARKLGCPSIGETNLIVSMIIIGIFYYFSLTVELSFLTNISIAIVCTLLLLIIVFRKAYN